MHIDIILKNGFLIKGSVKVIVGGKYTLHIDPRMRRNVS